MFYIANKPQYTVFLILNPKPFGLTNFNPYHISYLGMKLFQSFNTQKMISIQYFYSVICHVAMDIYKVVKTIMESKHIVELIS